MAQDNDNLGDDASGLRELEEAPGSSLYSPKGTIKAKGGSFGQWAKERKKKLIATAAIAIAGVVAAVVIFISLLPLKLLHIVNNIQSRFYSTTNTAVQKEVDNLFSNYVRRHVIPGLRTCKGSVIDNNCRATEAVGNGLVANLYNGWRTARFEQKLADRYGIEIAYDKHASGYAVKLKLPGMNDSGISLEEFENGDMPLNQFIRESPDMDRYVKTSHLSRNELADRLSFVLSDSVQRESRWKQTLVRFKVSRLVEKKYGVKLCVAACKYGSGKLTNNWRDWSDKQKREAARIFLSQRVLQPMMGNYQLALLCLFDRSCNPITVTVEDPPTVTNENCQSNCTAADAEPKTDEERDMQAKLTELAAGYGFTYTKDGVKNAEELMEGIRKNGLNATITARTYVYLRDYFTVAGQDRTGNSDEIAKNLSKYFTGIGIAISASYIIQSVNDMPGKIEKLNYDINTTAMAQLWTMYRSYADECNKESNCDSSMFGSFTDTLGPGDQDPGSAEKQLGGLGNAESSPLYQNVLNTSGSQRGSVFSFLSGKAFADAPKCSDNGGSDKFVLDQTGGGGMYYDPFVAKLDAHGGTVISTSVDGTYKVSSPGGQAKNYPAPSGYCDPGNGQISGPGPTCSDGKPVAAGHLGCPEYNAHQLTAITQGLGAVTSSAPWGLLNAAAGLITGPFDKLLDAALGAIHKCEQSHICFFVEPAVKAFGDLVGALLEETHADDLIQGLLGVIKDKAFPPSPIGQRMSGSRTVDMMIGGADVTGNEFAHYGLGGKKLSAKEVQDNVAYQYQQDWQDYSNQSLFAKMTDTNSKFSPVTKLALAMPDNWHEGLSKLALALRNPLGIFSDGLNLIASSGTAYAAPTVVSDPFNLSQYGYSLSDSIFHTDPEQYWNQYCSNGKQTAKWMGDAANYANGQSPYHQPENFETDPCLLIQDSVGAAGALYSDRVLTPDDTVETTVAGVVDCSAPGFAPYDPGKYDQLPANIKAAIEGNAPNRSNPGGCGAIPNAHPSDPNKQYMGEFHYGDGVPGACEGSTYGPVGGNKYSGHTCIGIKYRDPPGGSNSVVIPIN